MPANDFGNRSAIAVTAGGHGADWRQVVPGGDTQGQVVDAESRQGVSFGAKITVTKRG